MLKVISKTNRYVKILETKNGLRIRRTITHEEYRQQQQPKENQAMAKAKATLLEAVDQLNEEFGAKLRVKSKAVSVIVQTLSATLESIDPCVLYTAAPEGMLDVFGEYEVELPNEPTKKELKKYKKQLKKEQSMSATSVESTDPDDYDGEDMTPEEEAEATEPDPEPEPEPMSDEDKERLEEIEAALVKLKDKLSSAKKKKAKKIQAKIDSLVAESDAIIGEPAEKPPAKRKGGNAKGAKKLGVIATIGDIASKSKKWLTIEDVHEELMNRLPTANPDTTIKTVRAQLRCKTPPCRFENEKGIAIAIKGTGKEQLYRKA